MAALKDRRHAGLTVPAATLVASADETPFMKRLRETQARAKTLPLVGDGPKGPPHPAILGIRG